MLKDVTINDYANNASTVVLKSSRVKKSIHNINTVVKEELERVAKIPKDLKENLIPKENPVYVIPTLPTNIIKSSNAEGKIYPIVIWRILSEYIRPEDVGSFARLCKASFKVTCTAKFWFGLYKRYYNEYYFNRLSPHLRPEQLIRRYGLRTNVIRALFQMYGPFIKKLKLDSMNPVDPNSLQDYEYCSVWYKKSEYKKDPTSQFKCYDYFFKMKKKYMVNSSLQFTKGRLSDLDLLEKLDDIFVNSEEDCRILRISCLQSKDEESNFALASILSPVLGLKLKRVRVCSSEYKRSKLKSIKMIFQYFENRFNKSAVPSIIVHEITGINGMKIYDWWDPEYPVNFNNNMEALVSEE